MPELNLIRQYRLVRIRGRSHHVANGGRTGIYSPELRQLCELDSLHRMPEAPHFCPKRNCQARTTFTAQLCYAEGWAGAWGYVCDLCHGIHWPWQSGPTEPVLRLIEERRQFDREEDARLKLERRASADARRRQREEDEARKRVKKSIRETKKREKALTKAIRQAIQAEEAADCAQRKVADAAKVALKRRAIAERRKQASDAMRANMDKAPALHVQQADNVEAFGNIDNTRGTSPTTNAPVIANNVAPAARRNMRILDVVVWAKDKVVPTRTEVRVDADKPLCLGLLGHVLPDHDPRDPYPFEYWETGLQNWLPVIDALMDLALARDAPVLLVRVDTVTRCEQFGLELHCLQQDGALDVASISDIVEAAGQYRREVLARGVTVHGVWVVFWADDDVLPTARLLPLGPNTSIRLDDHSDVAAIVATQPNPRFEVWSHHKTEWTACGVDGPIRVRANTDTMLLRIANLEAMPRLGLEIDMLGVARTMRDGGAHNPALDAHGILDGFDAWAHLYEGY
ncbi:uncharacterized protein TRAVEDRAFT_52743 [Trametes versicolor FP-101664 SS1]|uniref:uncharacterized protein n=1 Tax=Trametes versicolor (strain FP-101664) TaxID=717944 RepID=UPI0004624366|nr:uncharacterized protein TRAVEDRAFT_52743 [Trametes versicolor FP-101664 SS1]EIW53624.1 hypothetical protein TRAVEDRAFT_52743 [Trametes versicolor FP-101664 SS1]